MAILLTLLLSLPLFASTLNRDIPCFNQVTDTLVKLNVTQPWVKTHESKGFVVSESKAGKRQKVSAWMAITDAETNLMVQQSGALLQHSFRPEHECRITTRVSKGNSKAIYSSLDFYKSAEAHPKFVIMLWSSQMAISLKQLEDLKGKQFAVPVIFVLDENADEKLAKAYVTKEKLPTNYLRKWNFVGKLPASIEHYPSALFVNDGQVVKYIPGYSTPAILEKMIKDYL